MIQAAKPERADGYAWKLRELLSELSVNDEVRGVVEQRLDEACKTFSSFLTQFEWKMQPEHGPMKADPPSA